MPQATRMGGSHPNGLEIAGVPLAVMPGGRVFYVHDNDTTFPHASDGNAGTSADKPLATLDAAVNKCTANQGDIIVLLPGHTEAISAANGADLDVAGIKVIGLGKGSDMATLDFTAAAGTVPIGAANVTIENVRFHANVTTITGGLIVEDGVNYAHIKGCVFDVETAGTDEFNNAITFVNNNNYCVVEDCYIDMGIAAAVSGVHLDADTDNLQLKHLHIQGDYSSGCILGDTTLSTNLLIEDCLLINGEKGDLNTTAPIVLLTGTHGVIRNNNLVANVASPAAAITADSCFLFNNKYSETLAAFDLDIPVRTDSVANVTIKKDVPMAADDLFDVNTGSVLIHELFAIVTTTESSGSSPVVSLQNDVDTGTDYAIATGLDLALIAVSDSLNFASHGSVLVKTAGGAFTSGAKPFVCPAGVIETVLDSGSYSAGDMTWVCVWSPIDSGATVSAAA